MLKVTLKHQHTPGSVCADSHFIKASVIMTSGSHLKVKGTHELVEFEGISQNNSIKWVTQMLGCFLCVYQKLATLCLPKTAACSRSGNLIQRAARELRYPMKI